ncbi:DUF2189 domain-containing protein [Pseudoroseomonas ludipueritiae]|uniref:DUF2189 domain-containing protein n=1 Tax=Pseudoroseomonas ludipueritiae TaxID=198093 RepID=A0ABR7R4T3_9PROT|nr:DUF2189 domain-containing protein [Pseudoroseomonas ludipueritiae]MBC9176682.1 DUF2189 domain-containing protein [Pseudoroseomonas ludipueritiae]
MSIRNPMEWSVDQINTAARSAAMEASHHGQGRARGMPLPAVRRIGIADLREALARGAGDLGAKRSDVIFLCLIYPIAGLVLARAASGYGMLPLIFPLISGFALIGPVAAVGLYEISRRREEGQDVSWKDVFGVVHAPGFDALVGLSFILLAIFAAWMLSAYAIFLATLGPNPPVSVSAFAHDVFNTPAGWTMIVVGIGVGFLFAVAVLTISVVSFPLLLERNVGLAGAVGTSVRAVLANPGPMAVWGMIVTGALVLGALPGLIGLIIVLPLLGHATWHLYRRVVEH